MRQKLESYLTELWYGDNKPPVLFRGLSKVFDSQRKRREKKLKNTWSEKRLILVPIIVVGNITVGGTGKTPVVIFLIHVLRDLGYSVGVISRGYGGSNEKNKPHVMTEKSTAAEVGDEAFMVHKLTSVPLSVNSNRLNCAEALIKQHPEIDILISDDGLQHYQLQRDVEIVVIDGQRGFGNGHLLPAGPLREPISRLEDVDLVLLNGHAEHKSLASTKVQQLQFDLQPKCLRKLNSQTETCEMQKFYGKTVHAFAGIGNPERFFKLLESLGIDAVRHSLADHAHMPNEFFSKHKNDIVIMTEKDAVKYPGIYAANFWFLPVELEMTPETKITVIDVLTDKLREIRNDL